MVIDLLWVRVLLDSIEIGVVAFLGVDVGLRRDMVFDMFRRDCTRQVRIAFSFHEREAEGCSLKDIAEKNG